MEKLNTDVLDFAACEQEPIRHLGLVQPHGCLLAADANGLITHASENLRLFTELAAADALNMPLAKVLGSAYTQSIVAVDGPMRRSIREDVGERHCVWSHGNGLRTIVEIESNPAPGFEPIDLRLEESLEAISAARSITQQAQLASELTHRIIGHDRIMVYRFLEDWSGEVIAEVRNPHAPPFLGLRYPASDIPPQARQLYLENLSRVIVDVNVTPAAVLSVPTESSPLDLSHCKLRSVSPYHIEYLKNLGVGASASVSIVVNGRLWGLIACHHDHRRLVSWRQREMLESIGAILSTGIARLESDARQRSAERIDRQRHALEQLPVEGGAALLAVLFGPLRIAKILHGCGAALWTEQGALRVGEGLGLEWLNAFAHAQQNANWVVLHSSTREELEAMAGPVPPTSSVAGIIVIRVPGPTPIFLFCFREEKIREVQWGGDINHPVLRDEISGRLSPRRSFATYQETVRGKSLDWTATDLDLARVYAEAQGARLAVPAAVHAQLCADALIALHELIGETSSLLHSLLDAFGEGISLLFRSQDEGLTLRYVNRKLFDWLEIESSDDQDFNRVSDLLGAVGVPSDFAEKVRVEPQLIAVHLPNGGVRNLRVEFKDALDLQGPRGREGLSALIFTDTTRLERGREALEAAKARTAHLTGLNTALERSREALEAAKAETEHLADLKTAFLANMSHEIRTPMNGIIGMLQVLRATATSTEQQHFLDIMDRSSETMLTVINDILDLAKLDAGRVQIETVPFDLLELVQDVVNLMESRANEKDLDFVLTTGTRLARHVLGDPTRLRQILTNLVSNAIKFTDYGRVALEIKSKPIDAAKVKVTIKIVDTGIGITEEYRPFVFEKFRQADVTTTRKFGGTGLGLSICWQLVNLMGGEISFTSMVGKGTTFEISIPFELDPAPSRTFAGAPVERTPLRDESPRHILVVEDNQINQIVVKAMLQNIGCVLDFADNGSKACEQSSARRYDLILMDCHMPGMDGFEATALIRKREGSGHRTPIIAITANAMPEDRLRCLNSGMDDYLAKPIRQDELLALVEKWSPKPNVH